MRTLSAPAVAGAGTPHRWLGSRVKPQPLARRPTITVVVPCYNYGHYLRDAVASALTQRDVEVRVIIVDDASTDNSVEVGLQLERLDDRITLIRQRDNQGHIKTYNNGLAAADGDYVVLLSADDLLTPGSLARASALLEANPSVGFAYGHPEVFSGEVPSVDDADPKSWSLWNGRDWAQLRAHLLRNCIYCPEVVMRTATQRQIGGYREDLPHSGDFEMWLRAALVADVGRVNGVPQARYRVHDASMARTHYNSIPKDIEARWQAFERLLENSQTPLDKQMLKRARTCLAREAVRYAAQAIDKGAFDEDLLLEYRRLAVTCDPNITRNTRWNLLSIRQKTRTIPFVDPFLPSRAAWELRGRVRYRFWLRYGL